MDTRQKYLNGDVDFLGNVNKIIPRRMELPLLMQTKIQIRRNMFGIRSRLFRHMKSYDYKFRSLGAEPKQVIRSLRPQYAVKSILKKPQKIPKNERSLTEKSSEWKLPPNVYNLSDFTKSLKKMGKRGPYQCFTVERDYKTVKNHHAPKPNDECCEVDFYDLPSQLDDGMKPSNFYKNRFLKAPRFVAPKDDGIPPPTKYFPQNYSINLTAACDNKKSFKGRLSEVSPIFFYPHTTVPMREMEFNKARTTPEPGRYNLHNLSCQCHMGETKDRMSQKSHDKGRHHRYLGLAQMKNDKQTVDDISLVKKSVINREPISFRLKSSASCDDLFASSIQREIRYNTMIRKKNLFSTKSGRPVAFLTASPRFEETTEKPIKLYKKKKSKNLVGMAAETAAEPTEQEEAPENAEDEKTSTDSLTTTKTDSKPKIKWMSRKRLMELAMLRTISLESTMSESKFQVFTKSPAFTFKSLASNVHSLRKVKGMADIDIRRLRQVVEKEQEEVVGIQENNIFVSHK